MKTIFNNFKTIFLAGVLTLTFSVSSVHAQGFSFFNFGEDSAKKETIKTEAKTSEEELLALEEALKTSCEYYDNTADNIMDLESASADAKIKIENVEDTIDTETQLRDSIFDSVKGLLGLQKKDKVIFREMKKDISEAKVYYEDLDQKVVDTNIFLEQNPCEDVKIDKAQKVDEETADLVVDEATFRKQFAASLKEKIKILQDSIKSAKK